MCMYVGTLIQTAMSVSVSLSSREKEREGNHNIDRKNEINRTCLMGNQKKKKKSKSNNYLKEKANTRANHTSREL